MMDGVLFFDDYFVMAKTWVTVTYAISVMPALAAAAMGRLSWVTPMWLRPIIAAAVMHPNATESVLTSNTTFI